MWCLVMTKLALQWLEKQSTFMQVGCVVIGHHEQLCEGKSMGFVLVLRMELPSRSHAQNQPTDGCTTILTAVPL